MDFLLSLTGGQLLAALDRQVVHHDHGRRPLARVHLDPPGKRRPSKLASAAATRAASWLLASARVNEAVASAPSGSGARELPGRVRDGAVLCGVERSTDAKDVRLGARARARDADPPSKDTCASVNHRYGCYFLLSVKSNAGVTGV